MWGSRGDKKKEKRVKKGTKVSDTVEGGGPSYSRGGAKLAQQLKHALKHQVAGSQEIRQEMKDLNAAFENEVAARKEATAEMEQLRHQLNILNSKVLGFEQQLQDEKRKTGQLESGMPMPSSVPSVANVRASWAPPPPLRSRSIPAVEQRRATTRLQPPPAVDQRRVSSVLPVPLAPPRRPLPAARAAPAAEEGATATVPPLALAPATVVATVPRTAAVAPPVVPRRDVVSPPPPIEGCAPPLAPAREAVRTSVGTSVTTVGETVASPPPLAVAPPLVAPPREATAPPPVGSGAAPVVAPRREQRAPPPRPPVSQRRISESLPAPLSKLPSPTGQLQKSTSGAAPHQHVVRGRGATSRGGWSSGTLRLPRARPAPVRPPVQF